MRRAIVTTAACLAAVALPATAATALECVNVAKPTGAGAFTVTDIRMAGNSGQAVLPGAFTYVPELGADIYVHGPEDKDFAALLEAEYGIDVVGNGFGGLPHAATPHYIHVDD